MVDDLRSPQFACEATQELLRSGRRSGCWTALQTSDRILRALSISSGRPGAYRYDDAFLLNEVAGQICLALATQLGLEQLRTLQRQLDDQIHDWNRSFRDIAATALCGIVQWGVSGVVSDANDAFLRIVGRTRKDIDRGLNCSDLASEGASLRLRLQAEAELSERGSFKPFQQEYLRPDRTRSRVLVSAGLLNQRQPPWLALVVDLSAEPDVILPQGSEVYIDLDSLQGQPPPPPKGSTLQEIEREHIARVLHDTKGVVGGEHGAASILGIKRTTLQYRMKKLEIPRH